MIFIGPGLSNPNTHFVTNVIDNIRSKNDLIIDLYKYCTSSDIFNKIEAHLKYFQEEYVLYNAKEDEDFIISFKKQFPYLKLITFFSDDEWRHDNYDRYLAIYSDFVIITGYKSNLSKYHQYGLNNVFLMRWAANPKIFHKIENSEKKYDVTFIGGPTKKRYQYVNFLYKYGVNIKVFGKGWDRYFGIKKIWGGFLNREDFISVVNCSKITLNFLWNNSGRTNIKGRTFELPACGSFQLSTECEQSELEDVGLIDNKTISTFNSKESALNKINYYLKNEDIRESIALASYTHVLQNHTWEKRFYDFFSEIPKCNNQNSINLPIFNVLVIVDTASHSINTNDNRLNIVFSKQLPNDIFKYHGVIKLSLNSTINNDSLYMMLFGLHVDKSDVIASNFYIQINNCNFWIRFRDRFLKNKQYLLRLLPQEALMYSGNFFKQHNLQLNKCSISYIEYPTYSIETNFIKKRILKFFFANHGSVIDRFRYFLSKKDLCNAMFVFIDKVWQKLYVES